MRTEAAGVHAPVGAHIEVTDDGPYRVVGEVTIRDADGMVLRTSGIWHLCRCGGSRSKPFCDATHGLKGFDGTETASHDTADERATAYPSDEFTVLDDRSRCAHFGQCTDRLPQVFRAELEPFVDPAGAPDAQIAPVVHDCPSGALALTRKGTGDPEEEPAAPSIDALPDGPYRVCGALPLIGADGTPYDVRARQTLCRCGQSRNKPFCDGSHWYAGFKDPVPPEDAVRLPTVYEALGGQEALERLMTAFYDGILRDPDPILEPLFRHMDEHHPQHVATWLAETFGGPQHYTAWRGGYEHMTAAHRGRALTEQQRQTWVARLLRIADDVGLTQDLNVRSAFVAYLEWGSRIAVFNSQPGADVIAHAPVPVWGWGPAYPYAPSPWDDPAAAERGRARHSAEHRTEPPHHD